MGVIGINVGEEVDFVFPDDKESKDPTVWRLGILDSITKTMLGLKLAASAMFKKVDDYEDDTEMIEDLIKDEDAVEAMFDIVRFGLKGFTNFRSKSGAEILFETAQVRRFGRAYDVVSDKMLGQIPFTHLVMLGFQILSINNLSEEEAKNSSSQSD